MLHFALCISLVTLGSTPAFALTVASATGSPSARLLAPGGSDDCSTADPLSGVGSFAFDTSAASTGAQQGLACGFGVAENDVWFDWTCPTSGVCSWDLCGGAGFNSLIAVYSGSGCPLPGTALACNDDSVCGWESSLQFACTAGVHYLLQLGGQNPFDFGTGSFTLSVLTPPPNDGCSAPSVLAGTGTFPFDVTAATTGSRGAERGALLGLHWIAQHRPRRVVLVDRPEFGHRAGLDAQPDRGGHEARSLRGHRLPGCWNGVGLQGPVQFQLPGGDLLSGQRGRELHDPARDDSGRLQRVRAVLDRRCLPRRPTTIAARR